MEIRKMKIVNIDLTKPNWREEARKLNKSNIRFALIDDLEDEPNFRNGKEDRNYKGMSVGTMSGGLEIIMFRTLDKIWAKLKNKFNS
jgi:hypothetical protein